MSGASLETARTTFVPVIAAALIAGGVTGAGVALNWYGPAVAVVAAAGIGLAAGLWVRSARGGRRQGARSQGSAHDRR